MMHRIFADNTQKTSVATKLRRERFQIMLSMIDALDAPVSILDVGGRPAYWEMMQIEPKLMKKLEITLLNIEEPKVIPEKMQYLVGDARNLSQFKNKQFDIVFSNSTIEHVGTLEDQVRMANEVRRVGQQYYIQTPNRYFPIEPHFVFPLFQFLPIRLRIWLLQHFRLGWFPKTPDYAKAFNEITSIRLLSHGELEKLFPEAQIYKEKYWIGKIICCLLQINKITLVSPSWLYQYYSVNLQQ